MKHFLLQPVMVLLACASGAFYLFYIDAPERWVTPGAVELSEDGMCITLTNISDRPVTLSHLGFAWKVDRLKHHMLLFKDRPREIQPGKTFTETHSLPELGSHLKALLAAEKHKLTLDIHIAGKRKGGFAKFSRLPVILDDQRD